jgi:hypothetical protein
MGGHVAEERRIRRRLEDLNEDLFQRFRQAEREVANLLEYSQGGAHLTYTPHGASHVAAVERNYDWLLANDDIESFSDTECYCLLLATQIHDALMIPREPGKEKEARLSHARAPRDYLIEHGTRLGVTHHEAYAVGEIVRAHHVERISEIEEQIVLGDATVDLRKLGACLSMADICHADSSRAPQIVFEYLTLDTESARHWRRHMDISGITRPQGSSQIMLSALAFSEEGTDAVREYAQEIDRQLQRISPYFQSELQQLTGVDLDLKRLNSAVDRDLRFKTDMSAVLRILIDGVYERDDVFIRELVQNALDATYIRSAQAVRRTEHYEPRVAITEYGDGESCRAVRVDDNGAGMDFTQVQDMLLLIGGTSTDSSSVRRLLNETTHKNLIATFGVGLLSCLKVASRIVIETAKAGATPVRLELRGIDERIVSSKAEAQEPGTSIYIELSAPYDDEIDVMESSDHYLKRVRQANVRIHWLPWSESTIAMPRESLLASAATEGYEPAGVTIGGLGVTEVGGADYEGWIWFPDPAESELAPSNVGELIILNDGVYVSVDSSDEWLPDAFRLCDGVLNFSARSIDLPVSRDRVMQNKRLAERKSELAVRSRRAVVSLGDLTHEETKLSEIGAMLAIAVFRDAADEERLELVRELNNYMVRVAGHRPMTLSSLVDQNPSVVYVGYPQGRMVGKLTQFDSKNLFHEEDDIVTLQSSWLSQQGNFVIDARRSDRSSVDLVETTVISPFLDAKGVRVVDLNLDRPIQGKERSKPLPKDSRNLVGNAIKFVEFPGLPAKRAWRVGRETWLNLAHPEIALCYEVLSEESDSAAARAAATMVKLAALNFEAVRRDLLSQVHDHRVATRRSAN